MVEYQKNYGDQVSNDDIFHYVYGLLHSPEYREHIAADLKKQLPSIPQMEGRERFDAFVDAGQNLAELHINYENLTLYQLTEYILPGTPEDKYERFAVTKMKYGGKAGSWDKTRIRYNSFIDIEDIPLESQE